MQRKTPAMAGASLVGVQHGSPTSLYHSMSYDQRKAACERCDLPRMEIDAYGMHLRGCLGCNTWQVIDTGRWCRLRQEDIVALRRSRQK